MTEKEFTLRPLFPNLVTMTALAFGVSSINMSFWGNWSMAVIFIALAAAFDFLDGKVARMLNVSSKFGAELDSLSDFVSFGVAPGFLMYMWTMDSVTRINALQDLTYKSEAIGIYWGFVLFVSMCCASRLARFNSLLDIEQPPYWKHFFMGVPAPAGGALTIMPLIFWLATKEQIEIFRDPAFAACFMVFSGIMMASKIPTLCLKHLHLPAGAIHILGIVSMFVIAGLISFPWIMISLIGICYLVSIPVSIYFFLKFRHTYMKGKK